MSLSEEDEEQLAYQEELERIGLVVEKAMRRIKIAVTPVPKSRKKVSKLTREDTLAIHQECVSYVAHQNAGYDLGKHVQNLCHTASKATDETLRISSRSPRQFALHVSLSSAFEAAAGHPKQQRALLRAYKQAFLAVCPRRTHQEDLLLALDRVLQRRRADLPEGVRALIAYDYAHAIDPRYVWIKQDPETARRSMQAHRRASRKKATRPTNRDLGLLIVV